MSEARPILVGEANPCGEDPRFALYPDPPRSAGGRLCRIVLGLSVRDYLRRYDRRNLCTGRWRLAEARASAAAIGLEVSGTYHQMGIVLTVVLLGSKVCSAFGVRFDPFTARAQGDCGLVILPHPSGLCRLWAEEGAIDRARATLRAAGVLPAEPHA